MIEKKTYSDEEIRARIECLLVRQEIELKDIPFTGAMLQQLIEDRDRWLKLATARYDVSVCIMKDFNELKEIITTLSEKYCDIGKPD